MKTIIDCQGNTIRQSKINDAKIVMKNQFYQDVSYCDNMFIWEHGKKLTDLIKLPIKLFNEKYSSANGITIEFNVMIDNLLPIGTVLFDGRKNIYYICTESYDRDEILGAGKLARCNNWLKWQDTEGNIFNYPIFDINSTQYNSGITDGKTMTLGSTQHMLSITADDNTIVLEHDKRFFLDRNKISPTVFKLTQNDTTAMWYDKGICKITVTEDQYNSKTDSIENWLCGYVDPKPENPTVDITITCVGSPQIRNGGSNKTFTAKLGDEVIDGDVVWSVNLTEEQSKYIVITPSEGQCKVKCLSNDKLVGTHFKLKCSYKNSVGEILVTVIGGV